MGRNSFKNPYDKEVKKAKQDLKMLGKASAPLISGAGKVVKHEIENAQNTKYKVVATPQGIIAFLIGIIIAFFILLGGDGITGMRFFLFIIVVALSAAVATAFSKHVPIDNGQDN